ATNKGSRVVANQSLKSSEAERSSGGDYVPQTNLTSYMMTTTAASDNRLPDYGEVWDKATAHLRRENFALLDVSSNADLLGISFDVSRRSPRDPVGTTVS